MNNMTSIIKIIIEQLKQDSTERTCTGLKFADNARGFPNDDAKRLDSRKDKEGRQKLFLSRSS